jgi:hypothetical protein
VIGSTARKEVFTKCSDDYALVLEEVLAYNLFNGGWVSSITLRPEGSNSQFGPEVIGTRPEWELWPDAYLAHGIPRRMGTTLAGATPQNRPMVSVSARFCDGSVLRAGARPGLASPTVSVGICKLTLLSRLGASRGAAARPIVSVSA